MKLFDDRTIRWSIALAAAASQLGIAVFAVYSSSQNRLSDGACIGGVFGTLGNLAILAVVVVWAIILAAKSLKEAEWRDGLKPLGIVALSSAIAIPIGLSAALKCTV